MANRERAKFEADLRAALGSSRSLFDALPGVIGFGLGLIDGIVGQYCVKVFVERLSDPAVENLRNRLPAELELNVPGKAQSLHLPTRIEETGRVYGVDGARRVKA